MQTEMASRFPAAFLGIWEVVKPFTMTSAERGFALWQAVNHVIDTKIPGAFVECGVWKGGSAMIMALTLVQRGVANRQIILFDTFDGMTPPAAVDVDRNGHHAAALMQGAQGERIAELVQARASLQEVQSAMHSTGYDPRLIRYVVGDVCATLPRTQTLRIALLRLDTDFYDSTLAELQQLYPRVSEGASIILDDYGHWQGARQAVDDYFAAPQTGAKPPMLWPIDYTGRGFSKPDAPRQIEIARYDYTPPGFTDPGLLPLFPQAQPVNPWSVKWPYLRRAVPHVFRSDSRNETSFVIGNATHEEAVSLHTLARPFAGRRGLEIGSHFGWTGAHLLAAGLVMDFVDPALDSALRRAQFAEVFDAVPNHADYRLWPDRSPDCIAALRASGSGAPWSFVFIDGDHDGDAPAADARAVLPHCAEDAVVMFHDLTSPHVAAGLQVFAQAGWRVGLFNTMQILGVAARGAAQVPTHIADDNIPRFLPAHLTQYIGKKP